MAGPEKPLSLHCIALNYYFEGPKFSLESIQSVNNQNYLAIAPNCGLVLMDMLMDT